MDNLNDLTEQEEEVGTTEPEVVTTEPEPSEPVDEITQSFMDLTDCADADAAAQYLAIAADILMSHLYYLKTRPESLPEQYEGRQVLIAADLYNKRGAEGELSHSENGISRTYESSWVSKELLADLPRTAGKW